MPEQLAPVIYITYVCKLYLRMGEVVIQVDLHHKLFPPLTQQAHNPASKKPGPASSKLTWINTKQVYISAGIPILPKRLVDKMTNWEYINFNELIPFCDTTAEDNKATSNGFQLFSDWYSRAINSKMPSYSGPTVSSHIWL